MVREYTNKLRDLLDEGAISQEAVVDMALAYMSEDDVKDMCRSNDLLLNDDELEEDEDEDEDAMQYYVFGDYGLEDQTLLYETTLYSEAKDFFEGYTRDPYDLGNYYSVEMGYFLDDGEWVDVLSIIEADRDEEDLYSDLDGD